jgi:hypothetical protein
MPHQYHISCTISIQPAGTMSLFTKKDLGLLLPDDTPGDPLSLRHTNTKYALTI